MENTKIIIFDELEDHGNIAKSANMTLLNWLQNNSMAIWPKSIIDSLDNFSTIRFKNMTQKEGKYYVKFRFE